jgi:hypothetical protein
MSTFDDFLTTEYWINREGVIEAGDAPNLVHLMDELGDA